MTTFINKFQSEWLKTRRSAASWLTIAGACLIPLIVTTDRLLNFDDLYSASQHPKLWEHLFSKCWQLTSLMVLPLGIILATSLVAQLEYRNSAWKQVLTTPQSLTSVFFVKLSVLLAMLLQFFIIFHLGIYLCGVLPSIVYRGIPFPKESLPLLKFLNLNIWYFLLDCLPVVALQFLVSTRFKNFLVPLGLGIGLYITSMIALRWKYAYWVPYTYNGLNFVQEKSIPASINWHYWAVGYFIVFILIGYILFITKKEKG